MTSGDFPASIADPKKLRIAHLTTIDASLYFLLRTELLEGLSTGYDVIGISAPGPYVEKLEALGIRHVCLPALTRSWSPRSDIRAAAELWRLLPTLDLDVLHTHTPKAGVLGRIVGRLRRVPIVVNTCHGLPATSSDNWLKRLVVQAIEAVAIQFSDAELFLNTEDHKTMVRYMRRHPSLVVGNGTDLKEFHFDEVGRARVRDELGIGSNDVLVGAVGRRVAEKGIFEFAAAARQLVGLATFVWIGPKDPDKMDAVDETLPGVNFLGERFDMRALYSAMDVFVLPSYREGFPRSAMEAAACARAMVLTSIRGSREVGEDGVEAMFVPARDTAALTNAIRTLAQDSSLRNGLGAAAHAKALQSFDQRAMAQKSFATYRAVAIRKKLDHQPVQ